jgi:hypothetical protein
VCGGKIVEDMVRIIDEYGKAVAYATTEYPPQTLGIVVEIWFLSFICTPYLHR